MKRVISNTHFTSEEAYFYNKTEDSEWIIDAYTQDSDTIELNKLQLSFTLKKIYKPA